MNEPFSNLPPGWSRSRVDRVATVNARIGWKALTAAEYVPDGFVFLATPNIKPRAIDFDNVNYISEFRYRESPELALRVGDVLLTKDGNTLGITNVVTEIPRPATVNGSIAVLRSHGMDSAFLRYVLASDGIQGLIGAVKDGMGVPHLFQSDIKRIPLPLPPAATQRAISRYLDRAVARIEALIEKKEQLRGAAAARFVALVDDSLQGRLVPLKWLLANPLQYGANESGEVGSPDWPRYIRITDLRDDGTLRDDTELRLNPTSAAGYYLDDGDLLFARSGATVGKCFKFALANGPSCFAGYLIRARLNRSLAVPDYVYLWTQSTEYWSQIRRASIQATIQNVGASRYGSLTVPVPPLATQRGITRKLEASSRRMRAVHALVTRQISLLEERRQALITAAVTGQLNILEVA